MKKRSAKKKLKPDESYIKGPMAMARFGKDVVFESNFSSDEYKKLKEKIVRAHPGVVAKINVLIQKISDLVKVLPPIELLQMSWMKLFMSMRGVQAEADVGHEQNHALRMVDYIQSIVASVEPSAYKDEVLDEDWETLSCMVEELFTVVNGEYQIGATFTRGVADPDQDMNVEEFKFKAQLQWCNVRGERFYYHQVKALEGLIFSQSDLIQKVFAVSPQEIVAEFQKIMHVQTRGLYESTKVLEEMRFAFLEHFEGALAADYVGLSPADALSSFLKGTGKLEMHEDALGKIFGLGLFDLRKITSLPDHFLDKLSWLPGEDKDFMADGEMKGWPLRIWPTFKRPFIKYGGSYFCFDIHSLFDNVYRQLEKQVFLTGEKNKQDWIKIRTSVSEQLPIEYLSRLLPSSTVIKEAYYDVVDPVSGKHKLCEADCLFVCGDVLFVIEVKAASFTYTSPADDFDAFTNSLKTLVQNPVNQGRRFLEFLESEEEVAILDKRKVERVRLRRDSYKRKVILALTVDPFTELAAQAQSLEKLGITLGDSFFWSLSIDDLQVYADVFTNPLMFMHFVEQRMLASKCNALELDDELDHLGLYLVHNNYSLYAEEKLGNNKARLRFNGYRSDVDKFFYNLQCDGCVSPLLKRSYSDRFVELLDVLSAKEGGLLSEASRCLLGTDIESRKSAFEYVDQTIVSGGEGYTPVSMYGSSRITIFPFVEDVNQCSIDVAVNYVQAVMLASKESSRCLICLFFDCEQKLVDFFWQELSLDNIPLDKVEGLKLAADSIREKRISNVKFANKKIGRNDACPCLSGKKYKYCCA